MQTETEDLSVVESIIEKYLVRRLREYNHKTIVKKIGGPGWRGWNDRLALHYPNAAHWLEVKRPKGGKYEPLQLRQHRLLRQLGFVVRVVNTKALVDRYVHDLHVYGPDKMKPTPDYDEYLCAPRKPRARSADDVRQARREDADRDSPDAVHRVARRPRPAR